MFSYLDIQRNGFTIMQKLCFPVGMIRSVCFSWITLQNRVFWGGSTGFAPEMPVDVSFFTGPLLFGGRLVIELCHHLGLVYFQRLFLYRCCCFFVYFLLLCLFSRRFWLMRPTSPNPYRFYFSFLVCFCLF